jgi:PKD repeat protein
MRATAVLFAFAIVVVLACAGCTHNESTSSQPQAAASTPTVQAAAAAPAAPAASTTATGGDEADVDLIADADPDSGEVPLHVTFSVEALLDRDLNQPTYTWDFGDGSPPSHEMNPQHTYEKPGDYLATVRMVTKTGERGWDEVDIEAEKHEMPAGEE